MRLLSTKACNDRHPGSNGVIRCELQRHHQGQHLSRLGDVEFVWGDDVRDARPRRTSANSTLQHETEHSAAAEIFTDGIKAERIWRQIENGHLPHCVKCLRDLTSLRDENTSEIKPLKDAPLDIKLLALEQAMSSSAKHHTDRRRGHGYRPSRHGNDFGHDTPALIEAPLCHPCHTGRDSELHRGPAFSEARRG